MRKHVPLWTGTHLRQSCSTCFPLQPMSHWNPSWRSSKQWARVLEQNKPAGTQKQWPESKLSQANATWTGGEERPWASLWLAVSHTSTQGEAACCGTANTLPYFNWFKRRCADYWCPMMLGWPAAFRERRSFVTCTQPCSLQETQELETSIVSCEIKATFLANEDVKACLPTDKQHNKFSELIKLSAFQRSCWKSWDVLSIDWVLTTCWLTPSSNQMKVHVRNECSRPRCFVKRCFSRTTIIPYIDAVILCSRPITTPLLLLE